MSDKPNPKTMEVLYDFLKDAPERQIENAASLDSKMVQIFGAASLVIGLVSFSSGGLAPKDWTVTLLLVSSLLAYAGTTYFTFVRLRPQQCVRPPAAPQRAGALTLRAPGP